MHDVRDLGIDAVVERTIAIVGEGPVFLSVDVDVLDPAFAPGTGTPEPGGMTSVELLESRADVAERLELVGADVVEVIPTAVGSADVTALVAERIVREILTGSRCAAARPELPDPRGARAAPCGSAPTLNACRKSSTSRTRSPPSSQASATACWARFATGSAARSTFAATG